MTMKSNNTGNWINAIGTVASSIGSIGGLFAQGNMNKKNRRWNEQMYAKQRADALADWNMQNEYNSPLAVMQRYKDAGLNPNLLYGEGTSSPASMVRSSSPGNYQGKAPDFASVGSVVIDALQAKALRANIQRTEAETSRIEESTRGGRFKNDLNDAIGLDRLAAHEANRIEAGDQRYINEAMKAQAELDALSRDPSGKLVSITAPSSMMQRVLSAGYASTFQKLSNLEKDGDIKSAIQTVKEFEARLAKAGIPPNSPWYLKSLEALLDRLNISLF